MSEQDVKEALAQAASPDAQDEMAKQMEEVMPWLQKLEVLKSQGDPVVMEILARQQTMLCDLIWVIGAPFSPELAMWLSQQVVGDMAQHPDVWMTYTKNDAPKFVEHLKAELAKRSVEENL